MGLEPGDYAAFHIGKWEVWMNMMSDECVTTRESGLWGKTMRALNLWERERSVGEVDERKTTRIKYIERLGLGVLRGAFNEYWFAKCPNCRQNKMGGGVNRKTGSLGLPRFIVQAVGRYLWNSPITYKVLICVLISYILKSETGEPIRLQPE